MKPVRGLWAATVLAAWCCGLVHAQCNGRTTLSQALGGLGCFGIGYNLTSSQLTGNTDNGPCSCRYMCAPNPRETPPLWHTLRGRAIADYRVWPGQSERAMLVVTC